jgi:6-phosphofructokinase 1
VKKEYPQFDVRVSILGHLQRGGSPTAQDRILATCMGVAAVEALLDDQRNVMIGMQNDVIVHVPFAKAIKNTKSVDRELLKTLWIVSR